MSNYIKATNFASKDTLATGNALKTLSGTEIDDEFNRIATASATKLDLAGGTMTGVTAGFESTGIDDNATSTAITIDSSGNVGIGSSSPNAALDLGNGSSGRGITWTTDSTTQYGNIWTSSNGARMIIAQGLKGSATVNNGFESSTSSEWARSAIEQDYGIIKIYTDAESTVGYGDAYIPTERMRVDRSGNVLVGTDIAGGKGLTFSPSGSASNMVVSIEKDYINSSTAVLFKYNGSISGAITYTGTNVAYNSSSDYRLKTDVQPMTGATATFKQLKPVNFEWIADGTRVDGFLAHELQEVIPAAATGSKDEVDEDGAAVMQGIDQAKIVPLLVATVQELIARIEDMSNRLQALEV